MKANKTRNQDEIWVKMYIYTYKLVIQIVLLIYNNDNEILILMATLSISFLEVYSSFLTLTHVWGSSSSEGTSMNLVVDIGLGAWELRKDGAWNWVGRINDNVPRMSVQEEVSCKYFRVWLLHHSDIWQRF